MAIVHPKTSVIAAAVDVLITHSDIEIRLIAMPATVLPNVDTTPDVSNAIVDVDSVKSISNTFANLIAIITCMGVINILSPHGIPNTPVPTPPATTLAV